MPRPPRIALLGDYSPSRANQSATLSALRHAAQRLGVGLDLSWLSTTTLTSDSLSPFDAYFGAPGGIESLEGMLEGIRFVRESGKPYLGTCGGFQHAALEFARDVAGIGQAASAEFDPTASQIVLSKLACQVAGKKLPIKLAPNTLAHRLYGKTEILEYHACHYGIHPSFRSLLEQTGLVFSGADASGEPRVLELPTHAFYLATLFVPQRTSTPAYPHPLLMGYLQEVALGT